MGLRELQERRRARGKGIGGSKTQTGHAPVARRADMVAEARKLAGLDYLNDGVMPLAEGIDDEGKQHLSKILASMDARAGAIRADLNDLVREGLAVAEDSAQVGAEEDFWREFKPAVTKLMTGWAQVSKILQQARESIGWEPEEGERTVTEPVGGAEPEDGEEDGAEPQEEGVQLAPKVRQALVMAIFKKKKAMGDAQIVGKKHVVIDPTDGYKNISLEDLSDEELHGFAAKIRVTQHAAVESAPAPAASKTPKPLPPELGGDPIAALALGQFRESKMQKSAKPSAPAPQTALPEGTLSKGTPKGPSTLDSYFTEIDARDESLDSVLAFLDAK